MWKGEGRNGMHAAGEGRRKRAGWVLRFQKRHSQPSVSFSSEKMLRHERLNNEETFFFLRWIVEEIHASVGTEEKKKANLVFA